MTFVIIAVTLSCCDIMCESVLDSPPLFLFSLGRGESLGTRPHFHVISTCTLLICTPLAMPSLHPYLQLFKKRSDTCLGLRWMCWIIFLFFSAAILQTLPILLITAHTLAQTKYLCDCAWQMRFLVSCGCTVAHDMRIRIFFIAVAPFVFLPISRALGLSIWCYADLVLWLSTRSCHFMILCANM